MLKVVTESEVDVHTAWYVIGYINFYIKFLKRTHLRYIDGNIWQNCWREATILLIAKLADIRSQFRMYEVAKLMALELSWYPVLFNFKIWAYTTNVSTSGRINIKVM